MPFPDHVVSRVVDLTFNAAQALEVPWLHWPRSILGEPGSLTSAPAGFQTELAAFEPFWSLGSLKRLLRVAVSIPVVERLWREDSGPIPYPGEYAGARPDERWLFINGICTDRRIALLNAEMLCRMFERPLTVLYNATDGLAFDLAESAVGKEWDAVTEAVLGNLDELVTALADPAAERVILISHSQGAIVAAVFLKLLEELFAARSPQVRVGAGTERVSPERRLARRIAGTHGTQPRGARSPVDRARRLLTAADVGKLELYCFANCATSMEPFLRLGPSPRRAPWIESYGNEYDIVARLGLLAPPHGLGSARIAGDRYRRGGAWGHLLNAHYLAPILEDLSRGAAASGLTPFHDNLRETPRLLEYLGGASPSP